MILGLILITSLASDPAPRIGTMRDPAITEPSGIVASRRFPGIFWVHNDSGNPAELFAVKRDGTLVRAYRVNAPNVDWEDIAIDDAGHLFVGDIGNNSRKLPIRVIYRVDEPDPSVATNDPLPVTLASYYRYAKKDAFDAEAMFLDGGQAVVISKRSDQGEATLYAVPLDPPATLFRPAVAKKLGTLAGFTEAATGANLSTDGKRLAVCSVGWVGIYVRDEKGPWRFEASCVGPPGQVEAITWDGKDLILANEQRAIFRIKEKTWRPEPGGRR